MAQSPSWQARAVSKPSTPEDKPLSPGTHWFRAWLQVPDNMAGAGPQGPDLWRDSMTFTLQHLAGPVAVYLNGEKWIEGQDIGVDQPQRFKVPKGLLEKGAFNAIVIQLQGDRVPKGLTAGPLFAGYFDEVSLEGIWEWTTNAPAPSEFRASAQRPAQAVYTEKDFHPATTVMQASQQPVRGRFVSPADALARLEPEPDLIVEELLHEPEVAQPTHVSFDEQGRMWIAQYRQYPYPAGIKMISRDKFYRSKYDHVPAPPPNAPRGADLISVHEDRDGDGVYETHRNVLSGLNLANAALKGHGGIWVMNTPYLLFYPDANGDDIPDRDPEVRLQGFGFEDTHSVANGLAWGPDGWLYGAQGSTTTSRVTRPGIDPTNAPGIYVEGCMVWRYHPERKEYEIFADGSGNTFGVSFDGEGRLFTGHNGGDTRGWHHIQEGLYLKQGKDPGKFGPSPNRFSFGELPMMHSTHPIPRFTHMTSVAGGTALPERLMGHFLGADPLHHSVIAAKRMQQGSTFETTDIGTPLKTEDITFRPVYLVNAPDGSLVVADFREEYIAHGQNYQSQIDPFTGRIYRLRSKEKPLEHDTHLGSKSSAECVSFLSHPNIWHRQTAVRVLSERKDRSVIPQLQALLRTAPLHPALESLWVLHQLGALNESQSIPLLFHPESMVRAWVIRLWGDSRTLPEGFFRELVEFSKKEPDAEVRSQILSTARRLPATQALSLVRAISMRTNDLNDPFIPWMAWFTLESHCATNTDAVLALFRDADFWKSPFVQRHLAGHLMRRLAASGTRREWLACAQLIRQAPGDSERRLLIAGFEEAFKGQLVPSLPTELVQALAESGRSSVLFQVRQGDAAATREVLRRIGDRETKVEDRLDAIRILGEVPHPDAIQPLLAIVRDSAPESLRLAACVALQSYPADSIATSLLERWPGLPADVQQAVLHLLASRPNWSQRLFESIAQGTIPRSVLNKEILARLRSHRDPALVAQVDKLFPPANTGSSTSVQHRKEEIRRIIAAQPGDPYRGEPLFQSRCGVCHTLFYKGGKIGPDLTAYQRDDLETLLTSILDPSAEIREGYEPYVVWMKDDRVLNGFLADQDASTVVLRGLDGVDLSLRRGDISSLNRSQQSLMPEGLLDDLSDSDLRHLFAYLRQSQPITK